MREALDMSWAEFVLRSIAFKDNRKYEMLMTREVAYQSYCAQFIFSKKKPASKEKFWPIAKETVGASDKRKEAFMDAYIKYKKQKDG